MPSVQRGQVFKRGKFWCCRWYDADGIRRFHGGFTTKSESREWVDHMVDEVAALRRGDIPKPSDIPTVEALIDSFLDSHEVDPATTTKMRFELAHAKREFGDKRIDTITTPMLATWRGTLPAKSRHHLFRTFKQVLEQAVTWQLLERNPAERIRNRRVRVDDGRKITPFESWDDVDAIVAELRPLYATIPIVLVGCGLRPEELYGLDRKDVDWDNGVLSIERVFTQGVLKPCKKSDRQRRRVPLRGKVLDALKAMPARLDSPVLFPAIDGSRIKHGTFVMKNWTPALRAAGIPHRRVYDCRHTFAAWSIRAGVQLFYLSRIMGTSVAMIDMTYGHLVPDSEDYLRGLFDTFDQGLGTDRARQASNDAGWSGSR